MLGQMKMGHLHGFSSAAKSCKLSQSFWRALCKEGTTQAGKTPNSSFCFGKTTPFGVKFEEKPRIILGCPFYFGYLMQNKVLHASFYLVIAGLLLLLLHCLAKAHNEAVHIRVRSTCQLQRMLHSLQTQQQPPLAHVHLHVHSLNQSRICQTNQGLVKSHVQTMNSWQTQQQLPLAHVHLHVHSFIQPINQSIIYSRTCQINPRFAKSHV